MSIKFWTAALLTFILLSTACDVQVREGTIPAATSLLVTSTLPANPPQAATETALPPPQPTIAPVDGATSTQVNVRAEPSTASNVLGIIPADTRVEITGKDPAGNWWQINYPQGVGGKGWVTAQYVVAANQDQIPIVGGNDADSNDGPVAVVQQQINVRSGPGTAFNSLGTLNPQDVVQLTGKDANGAWLQINFPTGAGPEGKGWVNAAFVQARGVENLPIITEAGVLVGTGTPTDIPPMPTATVVPAPEDNDSAASPLANVIFDPTGTRTLIYNGDVSAPDGDLEDWIQFTSFSERIRIEVTCNGSNVQIEFLQNSSAFGQAACAAQQILTVEPDVTVQVHIEALSGGSLSYSSYRLKVTTIP